MTSPPCKGWTLRHAANVIEHYAAVSGENATNGLLKLEAHKRRVDGINGGTDVSTDCKPGKRSKIPKQRVGRKCLI